MTIRSPFLVAALTLAGPAAAGEAGLCALALRLDATITATTGDPALTACPDIGFGVPVAGDLARSQAGAYDPATGRINLAPDLDLATPQGQGYLLHELVHAAQFRSGRAAGFPCPAALEAEAYALQADFLQAAGDSREAVLMRLLAGQLGRCGASEPGY
jgi:hypothetical protein